MMERDDNLFQNGDIVIFNSDTTGYVELQITTTTFNPRGAITGGATGGGDARGGMTGDRIQLPQDLPGYMGNTPRMYFVVRPTTLVSFFGRRTTTYTIVGFGGLNVFPDGRYIQEIGRAHV